ncbi:5456_t:CDS:2, partial [Racocetra persica]
LFSKVYKDERTTSVKLLQRIDNFKELVNYWGYPVEEHIVRTQDNYILGIQRIPHGRIIPDDDELVHISHNDNDNEIQHESIESVFRRCGISLNTIRHPDRDHDGLFHSDENSSSAGLLHMTNTQKSADVSSSSTYSNKSMNSREIVSEPNERRNFVKPVVLFYHGLMTCSELWVCNYEYENRLCCLLADAGYDVWFGNSRGNKYSMKHLKYDPSGRKFWNFSMDEFALYDLPDTINHWFQIVRSHNFQMYDELPTYSYTTTSFGKSCQRFPTQQITTPIAVFYGGCDSLLDITMLLEQIPKPVFVKEIPEYEHLDLIWASDINHKVFPVIFHLLRKYNIHDGNDITYSSDEPSDIEQNYIFNYEDYENQTNDITHQQQKEVIQRDTMVGERYDNESSDSHYQKVSEHSEELDSKSYNSNEIEQESPDESDHTREIIYREDYDDDDN